MACIVHVHGLLEEFQKKILLSAQWLLRVHCLLEESQNDPRDSRNDE